VARPSRGWPLRARLTAAFAAVVAVVLAVTGVLVWGQFARDLDATIDDGLAARARDLAALAESAGSARTLLARSGERIAQLEAPDGRLLATTRAAGGEPLLAPADTRAALRQPHNFTRQRIAGSEHGARLHAFAIGDPQLGPLVAVIGEPLDRRAAELRRLAWLLAIALPGALLLASYTGYQVAGAALRPVERMRARAAGITDSDLTERLPLPGTGDELDRLGETFNALLDRLEAAVERERRLVADASHELRTPLTVLQAQLEVALRGDGERLRSGTAEALEDARRLGRLADDLLVLARADQGRLPLRPEPIDVQELLERAAERHRAAAGDRPITATVAIEGGAVILADPDRSAQALDNLVANALRHGAGPVELTARAAPGGLIELTVRDHGPGLPAGYAERAFERFGQGGTSVGGSGLGLAIVEAIARAHGGRATVADAPGGGAVATIALPAA
jgi:signal transduction histidine kinase